MPEDVSSGALAHAGRRRPLMKGGYYRLVSGE